MIKLADKKFYKLTEIEVAEYVDRMKALVGGNKDKGVKGEA